MDEFGEKDARKEAECFSWIGSQSRVSALALWAQDVLSLS